MSYPELIREAEALDDALRAWRIRMWARMWISSRELHVAHNRHRIALRGLMEALKPSHAVS